MARLRSEPLSYIRMEPFPGVEPGGHSIPRNGGRRSEGHVLGTQGSNLKPAAPKTAALPVELLPNGAPAECHPRLPDLQGPPGHWTQGHRASDRNRTCMTLASHQHLKLARIPFRHERVEPPPGADPGRLPYGGRAAAVRGGVASGAGLEPAGAVFRGLLGRPCPTRNQDRALASRPCAARESNPELSD